MMTGDSRTTAQAVARQLGIVYLEVGGKTIAPTSAPKLRGHHSAGQLVFPLPVLPDAFSIKIKGLDKPALRTLSWSPAHHGGNQAFGSTPRRVPQLCADGPTFRSTDRIEDGRRRVAFEDNAEGLVQSRTCDVIGDGPACARAIRTVENLEHLGHVPQVGIALRVGNRRHQVQVPPLLAFEPDRREHRRGRCSSKRQVEPARRRTAIGGQAVGCGCTAIGGRAVGCGCTAVGSRRAAAVGRTIGCDGAAIDRRLSSFAAADKARQAKQQATAPHRAHPTVHPAIVLACSSGSKVRQEALCRRGALPMESF